MRRLRRRTSGCILGSSTWVEIESAQSVFAEASAAQGPKVARKPWSCFVYLYCRVVKTHRELAPYRRRNAQMNP